MKHLLLYSLLVPFLLIDCSLNRQSSEIFIIAHRGGMQGAFPENTLAAFEEVISSGVTMIETDLRITKDNEWVLFHDDSLERMTNGKGLLNQHTLKELKQLEVGKGEQIPTLEEALILLKKNQASLLLDIKKDSNLDKPAFIKLIKKYLHPSQIVLGIRSKEQVRAFKQIAPDIKILGFVPNEKAIKNFIENEVDYIRLWADWIIKKPNLIEQLKVQNIPIWTTAGKLPLQQIKEFQAVGVSGVIHDDPKAILSINSR